MAKLLAAICVFAALASFAAAAGEVKVLATWQQCGGKTCADKNGCADAMWTSAK
jgi:hypothetical protein